MIDVHFCEYRLESLREAHKIWQVATAAGGYVVNKTPTEAAKEILEITHMLSDFVIDGNVKTSDDKEFLVEDSS